MVRPHIRLVPSLVVVAGTAFAAVGCAVMGRPAAQVVAQPVGAPNTHCAGNRAPLRPSPLSKLPVGAVEPDGWLRRQLELQNDGFHGHLGEISRFLDKRGNAWLSADGNGQHGWEEVPYWLKGFADCAYLLGDQAHIAEAKTWIEGVFASQRDSGWFGPRDVKATVASTSGPLDLWPNMVMLACLQSYYEFQQDPRVLELMRRYFRFELGVPDDQFLPPYWQQQRGADNLWSVYWLYNRTGEPFLLELADKIHRRTANWTDGVPDWHNVNMAQAFGGPTFHWMQSGAAAERTAAERNWQTFRNRFGQVPGGMFGGDENCRAGFTDPRQAIETCGMVEMMFSCERLLQATGDTVWADRCEDVAFNSLPAAQTADLKALRYLTAPNQPLSDDAPKNPGIENGGAMYAMNPHFHRCCQHNVGHGWPYFVEHMWMAAPDDGLAAALYGPCHVTATVGAGDGVRVVVRETTQYPFRDRIEIAVAAPRDVAFPLFLRVPAWCASPSLEVDGVRSPCNARGGTWLRIDRTWTAGATNIALTLPMATALRRWPDNGSVSVDRGPLSYSLQIDERYVRAGGTDAWPGWSIEPASPWNYGLVQPDAGRMLAQQRQWPADDQPFAPANCPIALRATAKRIANWRLDPTGLVGELQPGPIASDAPQEQVTLLPMGACRLRISSFPVVDGPAARAWPAPPAAWSWHIHASHCFAHDSLEALRDGKVPGDEPEPRFPRFTWWDHQGTLETVGYEFDQPRTVTKVAVYWFDDQPGGGCAVPASWSVACRSGDGHREVAARGPYGTGKGAFQTVEFEPVTTMGIQLTVQLQPGKSAGIYELRVE